MAKKSTADKDAAKVETSKDAKDGERHQMTDQGPQGTPVEELPQIEREQLGKKLAEGKAFTDATKEVEEATKSDKSE